MKNKTKQISYFALIAIIVSLCVTAFAQTPVYRSNNRQVKNLVNRIEKRANNFRRGIDTALDRSNIDGTRREDDINTFVKDFEQATNTLKNNFSDNRSSTADTQDVLNRATAIDGFMRANSVSRDTQNQWNAIRTDLNTLAQYYRVSWDRTNPVYPYNPSSGFDSRLTGTYQLNVNQSDDVSSAIDRALGNTNDQNQRERSRNNLERRLTSPDVIMIQKRGQEVSLGSSMMSQVTFNADGVSRSETSNNGRTVQVSATANNSDLTIKYEGDRSNDFYVTFTPINSNQLRITRKVYLENRNQTITIRSIYDKTYQNARWDTPTVPYNNGNNDTNYNSNNFLIANNTRLTATLDSALSTRTARDNDQFTMTITSPSQYYGGVIQGRVIGEKSGVFSGRANLSLNFETVRMPNGNTYRFAGIVERVRQPNGNDITVNNEGNVQDSSQTTKTVARAGIGAVIGAIIGAVAGGGQGAVIGAGVGAGAGAGSVVLQGRDNLDLPAGTEFVITASAPGNVANNR